jgi:hypothetical protein
MEPQLPSSTCPPRTQDMWMPTLPRLPTSTTLRRSLCNLRPLLVPCTCPRRSLRMPLLHLLQPSHSQLCTYMTTARSERCLSGRGMAHSFLPLTPSCKSQSDTGCMRQGCPSSLARTNRCSPPPHRYRQMMCAQGHTPDTRSRCCLPPRLSTCLRHTLDSPPLVPHPRRTFPPRTPCTWSLMSDQQPLNMCPIHSRYTPHLQPGL